MLSAKYILKCHLIGAWFDHKGAFWHYTPFPFSFFLPTLRSSPTLFLMFESLLCDFLAWLMVVLLFLWRLVWVNDGMIVLFFLALFSEGVFANKMVFSLLLQSIEESLPHLLRSKPIPLLLFVPGVYTWLSVMQSK